MKLKINSLVLGCMISFTGLTAQQSSYEASAQKWLKENSRYLGAQNFSQLKLNFVKKGNSGETLRYQQMIGNVPVFQS